MFYKAKNLALLSHNRQSRLKIPTERQAAAPCEEALALRSARNAAKTHQARAHDDAAVVLDFPLVQHQNSKTLLAEVLVGVRVNVADHRAHEHPYESAHAGDYVNPTSGGPTLCAEKAARYGYSSLWSLSAVVGKTGRK